MAFSLTLTLTAEGTVTLEATNQAGGCSYPIASKRGGDLAGLGGEDAIAQQARGLAWVDRRIAGGWDEALRKRVEDAVRMLSGCLPTADVFDEEGRPRKSLQPSAVSPQPSEEDRETWEVP